MNGTSAMKELNQFQPIKHSYFLPVLQKFDTLNSQQQQNQQNKKGEKEYLICLMELNFFVVIQWIISVFSIFRSPCTLW